MPCIPVTLCRDLRNTRQDQENNTIAYYKQITNALLCEAIIELRAFYMAFIAAVSIYFHSRTKTFVN